MNDVGLFARRKLERRPEPRFCPSPTSTAACPAACRSRAVAGARPDDTVGIGGAINGLSAAHRDFLAAGGTGLLIGDGRLNYRTERILEAYYAYSVIKVS